MLYFTNTLTGKKEEFIPLKSGLVSMYNCGPTVYDYAHIGNLRAYVFADILRRTLIYSGYKVNQVINVTDIGHLSGDGDEGEDKMTKALKREGKPMTLVAMREIANFYFEKFKIDLNKLNIETPELFPFASDHIKEDIELVQKLTEKGFAYKTSDGIYFDTSKMPDYGKLGSYTRKFEEEHSRIGLNLEKRNSKDFALWKFNLELGYDAPYGKGFPGWHIECSAMSMKYLGETFDIHTGGIDHISIHHNNEIAQSESATGKQFVKYWLHGAFVNTQSEKMAKSEGNLILLQNLEKKGIHPLAYRYWLLQAKYSTQIEFSWETLTGAQNGFKKLIKDIYLLPDSGKINNDYENKFKTAIWDDLNTPEALALIQKLLKDKSVLDSDKKATILSFDKVLGLRFGEELFNDDFIEINNLPLEIKELVLKRETARSDKNWKLSDEIREILSNKGYIVEDIAEGSRVSRI